MSDASDNEAFVVDTAQKLQRLFGIHIVHLRTNVTSGFGAAVNLVGAYDALVKKK